MTGQTIAYVRVSSVDQNTDRQRFDGVKVDKIFTDKCSGGTRNRPAIPAKRRDAPVACPKWDYRCRHLVENLWARLKEWRAVATRYEKTATSFLAVIHIASAADWIKC